ncbi:MAG: hypothetical protein MZV64_19295 [Ignavibacteriales bacterium]|nr:hypothetical protein [Ignavibacteriales bacterium]
MPAMMFESALISAPAHGPADHTDQARCQCCPDRRGVSAPSTICPMVRLMAMAAGMSTQVMVLKSFCMRPVEVRPDEQAEP